MESFDLNSESAKRKSNSYNKIFTDFAPIVIRKFSVWEYDVPTMFRQPQNFIIEDLACEVKGETVKTFYKPISKF